MNLSSAVKQGADLYFLYSFIKRLSTPFNQTDAFKLGIVDEKGKILRKRSSLKSQEEKNAYTVMDTFIFNIKKLMAKIPFGDSRIASFAAALFLLKEHKQLEQHLLNDEFDDTFLVEIHKQIEQQINDDIFVEMFYEFNDIFTQWENELLIEDAPANSVGSGQIAGLGIDAPGKPGSGEPPGISKLSKKKVLKSNEFMINPKAFLLAKMYGSKVKNVQELARLTGLPKTVLNYHNTLPTQSIILINEKTSEMMTVDI